MDLADFEVINQEQRQLFPFGLLGLVNFIANRVFAYLFSYLVTTSLTDTLCGTKVLLRGLRGAGAGARLSRQFRSVR